MAKNMKSGQEQEISILRVEREYVTFCLWGASPLIYHRMAEKAKRELLLPRGRKNAAERAATLKHDPLEEYRASVYRCKKDGSQDTRLVFPGQAFHKAISDAALDLPGLKKAQIGRLCGVKQFDISIYGIPQLAMHVVRNSDMNHTPDIRTRAIVPQWACEVEIWFSKPLLRQSSIVDLMAAAGIYIGIGDWRQQKGSGSHGLWNIVDQDDAEFRQLVKNCTRVAQDRALETPAMYDDESQELYDWYLSEVERRRDQPAAPVKNSRRRTKDGDADHAAPQQ